jgi:hypothetical protein
VRAVQRNLHYQLLRSGVLITGSQAAPECVCEIVPSHATKDARGRNDCRVEGKRDAPLRPRISHPRWLSDGDACAGERAADALHCRWIDAEPVGNDPYARPPTSRQSLIGGHLEAVSLVLESCIFGSGSILRDWYVSTPELSASGHPALSDASAPMVLNTAVTASGHRRSTKRARAWNPR